MCIDNNYIETKYYFSVLPTQPVFPCCWERLLFDCVPGVEVSILKSLS